MYDFYPKDARQRDPGAGMNQLRLSFCFSESAGQQRRDDMREAVEAFCQAAKAPNDLADPTLKTEGSVLDLRAPVGNAGETSLLRQR